MIAGDKIYLQTDQDYTLTVVTATSISGTTTGVATETPETGVPYWIGPNLDGRMRRSQERYKTENALGRLFEDFTVEGGYPTDLINEAATATAVVDRLTEWNATRRLRAVLTTHLNALDVELGDAVYLDHPWLPVSRRPIALATLNGAVASGDGTIEVQAGEGAIWRDDDRLLIDFEVLKITNIVGDVITATRAQAGTVKPASHADGAAVNLLMHKWEVTGVRPFVDADTGVGFELELQEMPRSYTRAGICVADGHPNGSAATQLQLFAAGWSVYNSGRLQEFVEDSDYSYAVA